MGQMLTETGIEIQIKGIEKEIERQKYIIYKETERERERGTYRGS